MKPKVIVILRHENSLNIVREYLAAKDIESITVALDPVEMPDSVPNAIEQIKSAIHNGLDAVIAGTKVYDTIKLDKAEPPQRLIDFLLLLKEFGIAQTPICLTHLSALPDDLAHKIRQTGLNVSWVEHDNLKNDGMNNLGPLLIKALP